MPQRAQTRRGLTVHVLGRPWDGGACAFPALRPPNARHDLSPPTPNRNPIAALCLALASGSRRVGVEAAVAAFQGPYPPHQPGGSITPATLRLSRNQDAHRRLGCPSACLRLWVRVWSLAHSGRLPYQALRNRAVDHSRGPRINRQLQTVSGVPYLQETGSCML